MVVDIKVFFYIFNICNNIKVMWVWGRRHCGWQGKLGGEVHEGITSGGMFFNEGRDVISRADVGCLTAPMCVTGDNTKVHDIIKVEKGEMDASKEEEKAYD